MFSALCMTAMLDNENSDDDDNNNDDVTYDNNDYDNRGIMRMKTIMMIVA